MESWSFAVFVTEYTYHDAMMNNESIEFAENCNFDLVQIQIYASADIFHFGIFLNKFNLENSRKSKSGRA